MPTPNRWIPSWLIGGALPALLLPALAAAQEIPRFEHRTIDPKAGEVVYAVTAADVDGDGRLDIVAVTEDRVLWYQAPDWKRRVIIDDQTQRDNVCIDTYDITGDGQIEFALGAGWLQGRNTGTIQWLRRGDTLDEPWSVHMIGAIPWTHRMRFADVLGTGRKQLVVSPLTKTVGDGVEVTAFEIPENPVADRWRPTVLDGSLNRMHNHWHFTQGEQTVTITASQEGVHRIRRTNDDFERKRLANSEFAGEIKDARLGEDQRLIATIEPMHGNQVVVYVLDPRGFEGTPRRVVLDDTLGRGHGLWAADLTGDGRDELVVGHSEPATGRIRGPGVYIYQAQDDSGLQWTKHIIDDGGMATEDLIVGDFTGNGRLDIVAGGRETHNIKLYKNLGGPTDE